MDQIRNIYFIGPVAGRADTDALVALLHTLGVVCSRVPVGQAGLEWLRERAPGCVLIDIDTVQSDLPAVFAAVAPHRATLPVVVMSAHAGTTAIIDCIRLGAADYLAKPVDREALAASLNRLSERFRSEFEAYRRRQDAHKKIRGLSAREREILRGLLAGWSNKALAHQLALSVRTIEMHRSNLMTKLGAQSLAHAVQLAVESGIDLGDLLPPPSSDRRTAGDND